MKALVLERANHFAFKNVPKPKIGSDEVLVKIKAASICGSDIHGMDGSTGRRIPPIIMGHEAAGEIAKLGKNVFGWQVGDRVTFDSTISCGTCHFCRRGMINLCNDRRVLGVSCDEYRQHGAFAEYVSVPQHILYRLPEELTFEQAALVEPTSIAFHAVELTPRSLNDTVVVVGAGTIGLLTIQALRLAGCGHIIVVDLDQKRLELAQQLGADETCLPDTDTVIARVMQATETRGADIAFEAVGISSTVELATQTLRKGGTLTLIGNLQPRTDLLLQSVVTRQLRLQGSCASNGEYPACIDAISRREINVEALISKVAPLSSGADWFQKLKEKESGLLKVILKP